MSWRDLLQNPDERVTAAWLGGRALRSGSRRWTIEGKLPDEHGWYVWTTNGRKAELHGPSEESPFGLVLNVQRGGAKGYLVGDLFVSDQEGAWALFLLLPGRMKLRITKRRKYHSANVTLRGNENDMSMIITAARDGMRKLAERAGPTGEYAAELLDRADELLDERDSYVYGVEEEL